MRVSDRDDDESRPSTIGSKRSSTSNSPRGRKKRRRNARTANNEPPIDDSASKYRASSTLVSTRPETILTHDGTIEPSDEALSHAGTRMTNGLGINRLAMGFAKPQNNGNGSIQAANIGAAGAIQARSPSTTGQSPDSAIEISDDEEDMADSEGGIVLNVNDRAQKMNIIEISDDEESGEISSDGSQVYTSSLSAVKSADHSFDVHGESFIIDPNPENARKRLIDLTPSQREEQLRYAFYYLERDEVDLNRPVVCLRCLTEGHIDVDCQQKTLFPLNQCSVGQQVKLWISCCVCASKSHLVGDCPEWSKSNLDKWSLSKFKQGQIINLSLQSGTRKLEKDAETRGMRPQGLSIKGRANRHNPGHSQHIQDGSTDDDEPFLHDRRPQNDGPRHIRYDRFDPPSDRPSRPRGGWYATDSFGRRRSRSPLPDQRHDRKSRSPSPYRGTYRQSTASSAGDSWRPPPPNMAERSSNGDRQPPPGLGPNIKINLPTRKGSNTWVHNTPTGGDSPNHVMERKRQPHNHAKRRKKGR